MKKSNFKKTVTVWSKYKAKLSAGADVSKVARQFSRRKANAKAGGKEVKNAIVMKEIVMANTKFAGRDVVISETQMTYHIYDAVTGVVLSEDYKSQPTKKIERRGFPK